MSATAVLPFPMLPALAGSTAEPVPSGVPAMATLSDGALLERVVRGDADAFTVLYRRYERPVFAMLLRLASGRRAIAEEWLQEAFTRVWLGASTHDPSRGEVRPWVYRIALNTARSEMARKRYPDFMREVVVLRCSRELTFAEMAEVTGAPQGTLKSRFHRAVAALREELGQERGKAR